MASLRPVFTGTLATRLAQGAAIHLIGPHGQGRRRTLADLRHLLPEDLRVLQANLRHHPHSIQAMLEDLAKRGDVDRTDSVESLLKRLRQRFPHTLLILHNLDELHPGSASGYDDTFYAHLNAMSAGVGMALLCVSTGLPTPLNIETLHLPPLTSAQVLAELTRRQPPVDAKHWPEIANWIAAQPSPYSMLEQPGIWPNLS